MVMITISSNGQDGKKIEATFNPEEGMKMVSFKRGDVEVIDQSSPQLGALIGPHFGFRNPKILPKAVLSGDGAKVEKDPFPYGVARYAPWTFTADEKSIKAVLKGTDVWKGVELKALEGQGFTITYAVAVTEKGLDIGLTVVSETDSLVGIQYNYVLADGKGKVFSRVKDEYIAENTLKKIPAGWAFNSEDHTLEYELDSEVDLTFFPFTSPIEGEIQLDTGRYQLLTTYRSCCEENSWRLYRPKGASYVSIEPVSSQDPRYPNLSVSSLQIQLAIL